MLEEKLLLFSCKAEWEPFARRPLELTGSWWVLTGVRVAAGGRLPAVRKAFEKMKEQRLENVLMPVLTPVTVDLFSYQTMGRHCLESGYIKILKTAWEGKKTKNKNNNIKWYLQKIPQLYNAKKYISIYIYVHIHIFHSYLLKSLGKYALIHRFGFTICSGFGCV